MTHARRTFLALLGAQAAIILGIIIVSLRAWRRDVDLPLQFSRDALEYLLQTQGTIENGWWWFHPRLSAPVGFWEVAYPSNTNVDQAIVWAVSLFTKSAGLCLNVSWAIAAVLSGTISTCWLRRLGVSRPSSLLCGVLFALSPYALARNVAHFSLVTYLVPIPCAAALMVACGRLDSLKTRTGMALLGGCTLLGLNYVYYAFFGCSVLLFGTAIASVRKVGRRGAVSGLLLIVTTCTATAINLAPSLYVRSSRGTPLAIGHKQPSESEVLGLKLRHLITPVNVTIAPFRAWVAADRAARFPLENENRTARLGLLGTLGLFALWAWPFVRRDAETGPRDTLVSAAGSLATFALLLGTVGGFGSVFSLLIDSNIRAYNRLFPFIHFFTLVALGCVIDQFAERGHTPRRTSVAWLLTGALLVVGVFDQSQSISFDGVRLAADRTEHAALQHLTTTLEARLPASAMVFQLPVTAFPANAGDERMEIYDQAKPYLLSRRLRWSFPAFDDALARWQRHVGNLPLRPMAAAAKVAGFSAVLIDRYGYRDSAQSYLDTSGFDVSAATIASDARYVALDLSAIPTADLEAGPLPRLSNEFGPATSGLTACGGPMAYSFDFFGENSGPFPAPPVAPRWGDIAIAGWAGDLEAHLAARDVDVVLDGKAFPTFYGMNRSDVAAALGIATFRNTGFTTQVPRTSVARGLRRLSLRVVAADGHCYFESAPLNVIIP